MKFVRAICLSLSLLVLACATADRAVAAEQPSSQADSKLKLSELTPQIVQERLQSYLNSPLNKYRKKAAKLVDLSRVKVESEGFNKDPKNAEIRITYEMNPGQADSPEVKEMVNAMVLSFFKDTLEREAKRQPVAAAGPEPQTRPPITRRAPDPSGMSEAAVELVSSYFAGMSGSLSAEESFDVAYACYARGMFADAIILADRGLSKRKDARLLLVKGVCQLHLGQAAAARQTAIAYEVAKANGQNIGLDLAQERVNDAMSVRLWSLTHPK